MSLNQEVKIGDGAIEVAMIPSDDAFEDEYEKNVNGKSSSSSQFDVVQESKLLLKIALPAVAVQFSVLFIFPQTASIVGRELGTEPLAGFSLGSLVGNLTCLSVMVGAMTAADTLMPRAYGAERYSEVGLLAIRATFICTMLLIVPIIPLLTIMEWIFDMLGQDEYASHLASGWIKWYLIGVPSMLGFRVVQSFLNAQHQVIPLVVGSVVSCFCIHPVILPLCVSAFGFYGSSIALALTQYVMLGLIILYLCVIPTHKPETWPGLSMPYIKQALSPGPMLRYLNLSLGGVFSLSEWWWWETICFIVGSFGVVPLCVHTIAYNLVPLLFMIPLGISIGLTVRMGNVIGQDVTKAKKMAVYCMTFTIIVGAIVSFFLYIYRIAIAKLFTNDDEVIQGCEEIWFNLCIYIFILHIFGINSAILRALGMQWIMAAIIFTCLWLGALPAVVYFAVHQGGGVKAVWSVLPKFHALMQILLASSYMLFTDWNKISMDIRERNRLSMIDAKAISEVSNLLDE